MRLGNDPKHVIVWLTGAQSSGPHLIAKMLDFLMRHGRVLIVDYNRKKFDPKEVVERVGLAIKGYPKVTLIGLSMGGLLSYYVIEWLKSRRLDSRVEYQVVLACAPRGVPDLDNPMAKFAPWIRPGLILSGLLTRPFWKLAFNPPKEDQIEPGDDRTALEQNWKLSRTYPLSGWFGEVGFIAKQDELDRTVLQGVKIVFIRADGRWPDGEHKDHDGAVKYTAYDSWGRLLAENWDELSDEQKNNVLPLYEAPSTHIGCLEYVKVWLDALAWAFDKFKFHRWSR